MKVSFLLPTNRDYAMFASNVVRNINETCSFEKEILIYSPQEVHGENVKWFKEAPGGEGCVKGYNYLYKKSTGDFIVIVNDENGFRPGTIESCISFLASPFFLNRKLKVMSVGSDIRSFPNSEETRRYTCIPTFGLTSRDYRVCGYPVFQRSTIEEHLGGYVFHPEFKHHYGDNYLPFYAGFIEEPINDCPTSSLIAVSKNEFITQQPHTRTDGDEHDAGVYERLIRELATGERSNYVN